jgi:hypothetical protein
MMMGMSGPSTIRDMTDDPLRVDLRRKPVYLDEVAIGFARTWYDVAALLTNQLGRAVAVRAAQDRSSEGPDGFFVSRAP